MWSARIKKRRTRYNSFRGLSDEARRRSYIKIIKLTGARVDFMSHILGIGLDPLYADLYYHRLWPVMNAERLRRVQDSQHPSTVSSQR
jgi:hypothetical protein